MLAQSGGCVARWFSSAIRRMRTLRDGYGDRYALLATSRGFAKPPGLAWIGRLDPSGLLGIAGNPMAAHQVEQIRRGVANERHEPLAGLGPEPRHHVIGIGLRQRRDHLAVVAQSARRTYRFEAFTAPTAPLRVPIRPSRFALLPGCYTAVTRTLHSPDYSR